MGLKHPWKLRFTRYLFAWQPTPVVILALQQLPRQQSRRQQQSMTLLHHRGIFLRTHVEMTSVIRRSYDVAQDLGLDPTLAQD